MTLTAQRDQEQIRVGMTYGPISASCVEHIDHVRSFWHHLGVVLDEIEKEPNETGSE